ncbi:hypothetical protein SUGI_0411080 [Cryptomeria japonica]|nr:uncharacterized protein LOC131049063 isoform X2 [Cryptomeria japonica]XP_057839053.1 uncharacterized protein LOC131049063 isoform X2 [Cryptomeria japonica]GLJ21948.1 hypothetical protein SUGI_0411080 [Cryptomeria japonica]
MEEANASAQQHQQQQQPPSQQQQLLLQHQQQQQFLLMQQQFQQHQQSINRFPSNPNIANNGSHLLQSRNPILHHNHLLQQHQQQHQQQQQHQHQHQQQQQQTHQQKSNPRPGYQAELEMAHHDAWKVCNPDIKRPFSSLEDACERILPYHVVTDYEIEDDDRLLDSDTAGQMLSRFQVWEQNLLAKVGELSVAFERQINTYNSLLRRRAQGDLRSEERLMIEQIILHDERQKLMETRAEIESREKAGREAAEAKRRIAIAEQQARAEAQAQAQAHAEVLARADAARVEAARVEALAKARAEEQHTVHESSMQEQGVNMDEILHNWGPLQREDDAEPSEDFLNDDHDQEAGDDRGFQNMGVALGNGMHDDWRDVGELDLNMR